MKHTKGVVAVLCAALVLSGCAHTSSSWFSPKPARFSIMKVNSNKKYLHLMTRTRGILGTTSWGKFNYDVVELPYEKQGEYITVTWKRSGGPKVFPEDVVVRVEYRHQNGVMGKVEEVYLQSKRGRHLWTFQNTGDAFVENGEIDLWRVTVWVGKQMVADQESQLWWTIAKSPA